MRYYLLCKWNFGKLCGKQRRYFRYF